MRIFTAVEIPEEAKLSIYNLIKNINTEANVKWVKKDNFHVTLKFFGEVKSLSTLENILKDAVSDFEPFHVSLSGLGAFPSKSRAKVLWVGLGKGENELKDIYKNIEDKAVDLGFKKEERNYTPHITFGRVKKGILKFPEIEFSYPSFLATKITLFESILKPSGPIYRVINRFPEE